MLVHRDLEPKARAMGLASRVLDATTPANVRQEYPEAGGLVSDGADSLALFARAATYVDRILGGTPPAELPFEMASTFRLVLNLAAARRIGLAVPRAIRIRADAVIE